jgi:hypothetical protein
LWRINGVPLPYAARFATHFVAHGLGLLLVETGLMQKSTPVLGNPMYSIAVVLAALLLGGAVGSGLTTTVRMPPQRLIVPAAVVLCLACGDAIVLLTNREKELLAMPAPARMAIVAALLLPAGIAMGVFFPSGLRQIESRAREFVPWAWGINGAASVYGSVGAIVLALASGFTVVVLTGLCIYVIAAGSACRLSVTAQPATR